MTVYKKLSGPWRITFDTNPNMCNLRCIMCEVHSIYNKNRPKTNRIMPFELIKKVVNSASRNGLKEIIPSTMGEPLLYPYFEDIIWLAKKHNIKVNLTTNGTFPKKGAEGWGEIILPVASDVKISINGAIKETAESIMVGVNFEKQIENTKKFIEVRDDVRKSGVNYPTVTFQVTYMERNVEELPLLLKMAVELDVDRFKGHHVWVTWPELEEESLKRDRNAIKKWNNIVEKLYETRERYHKRDGRKIILDNVYKLPLESSTESIPDSWLCPFTGREAWIAWDGTFNVCCSPDDLRKTLGYFGNVNNADFMGLWNSEKYNRFIENWGNYEVCKNCNMRRPASDIT